MFAHMVMFRLPDEETCQQVLAELQRLAEEIDEVESLQAGRDVLRSDRAYDVGMLMTFADRDAFERYVVHPVHVPVARWIDGVATGAASVDWED